MSDTRNTNGTELRMRRFEDAWLRRSPEQPIPDWRCHLPADDELCHPLLIADLLRLDIECRVKAGLPALLAERYFEHPRLQRADARLDAERQIELIQWEYHQRWQMGDRARRSEYQSAFPQYADALRQLQPRSTCPHCRRPIELDETDQTFRCPHCDTTVAPPTNPAPLQLPRGDSTELDLRGYELLEALGKGGMGEVYRCADPALGRDLAIKVIKDAYRGKAEIESRFLREAHITGSLQHPSIVAIHNLGRLRDGRLHYTMRLVRGRTFADILKDEAAKPERWPELLTIFLKICQAVAHAHSKRVLHRDLKPANIMVGRFGEVQVMDWGLAKVLSPAERGCVSAPCDADGAPAHGALTQPRSPDAHGALTQPRSPEDVDPSSDLTRMGMEIGTPSHMAPEQALGEWDRVDERADVFALGSILCEILTGRPPYTGRDSEEMLRRAKRGDVADALARLEQCGADAALLALCRDCLALEPRDRPRDAGVVAQRVAEHQAEVQQRLHRAEVERAEAVVQVREERKRRRRTRLFLAVLAVAAMIAIWLAVRATQAEGKARDSESNAVAERNRAVEAEGKAKRAAEESRTVLQFFQDTVLAAGRPKRQEGGLGREVTLRQAVDAAESQIARAFAEQPLPEASIRDTMGNTYHYLGETERAIEQHRQALQLRTAHLGPNHPDTLGSANNLAAVHHAAGQTDQALPLFRRVLEGRRVALGEDHPDTLRSANNLAIAYQAAHQPELALPLLKEVLDKRRKTLGDHHADTLKSMNNLAYAYGGVGRMEQALPLLEEVLAQRRRRLGDDHPDTLLSLNNLAYAYQATGRRDKMLPLYEEALRKRRAALGDDHRDTLVSIFNLAAAYHDAGRLDDEQALLRELLRHQQKKAGAQSPGVAVTLAQLAASLLQQKKFTKAEPLLRQCLRIREKNQAEEWTTFNTRSVLGEALAEQKKYADAEPLLVQGYEGMKQRQDKIPSSIRKLRLSEARQRLAQLYDAWGKKDEANQWRKTPAD